MNGMLVKKIRKVPTGLTIFIKYFIKYIYIYIKHFGLYLESMLHYQITWQYSLLGFKFKWVEGVFTWSMIEKLTCNVTSGGQGMKVVMSSGKEFQNWNFGATKITLYINLTNSTMVFSIFFFSLKNK